jgi:hypothetical protein
VLCLGGGVEDVVDDEIQRKAELRERLLDDDEAKEAPVMLVEQ